MIFNFYLKWNLQYFSCYITLLNAGIELLLKQKSLSTNTHAKIQHLLGTSKLSTSEDTKDETEVSFLF